MSSSVDELLKEGWHADLAEGLAVAQREGKPVLIDMWATWCKNCLTMDKTTLVDPSVKAALDGFVKIKFQAESPDESPAREVMQRFGAVGSPHLCGAHGEQRRDQVVFESCRTSVIVARRSPALALMLLIVSGIDFGSLRYCLAMFRRTVRIACLLVGLLATAGLSIASSRTKTR